MAGVLQAPERIAAGLLQPLAGLFALRPPEHRWRIEVADIIDALHHADDIDRDLTPAIRTEQRPRRLVYHLLISVGGIS
jgi:hypothetical protein